VNLMLLKTILMFLNLSNKVKDLVVVLKHEVMFCHSPLITHYSLL
jgi:hypothetical protein